MISIRRQLVRSLLPGILLLVICSGAGLYLYVRQVLTAQFDAALIAKAHAVAAAIIWDEEHPFGLISPDVESAEFSAGHHPAYFQVWWADGKTALRSKSLGNAALHPLPAGLSNPNTLADVMLPNGHIGRATRVRFTPVRDADDVDRFAKSGPGAGGPLTLELAERREAVDEPLQVLAVSLATAAGLMAAGVIVIVAIAVNRSLRPLSAITEEASRDPQGSFDHRFPVEGMPAELVPVCQRLNGLLGRLQEAFQRERRFTADVSHELRTPIAELKSLAEVALKFPADSVAAEAAFRDALAVARQMEAIVTTLLSLARSASHLQPLHRQPVDVAKMLGVLQHRFAFSAEKRRLTVHNEFPASRIIQSDPTLVEAIFSNLLCNAVDHSPMAGRVSCRLVEEPGGLMVEIANTAGMLEPQDLPRMFEPFWQKDPARSNSAHAGLGLALAAAYAKGLGYELRCDMPDENWFRVQLRLS